MTTQPCLPFDQHLPELPASQIRHCPGRKQQPRKQLRLPFITPKESRLERIERIMGTIPKVRPAAQLFDYRRATAIAKKGKP